jgi:hypothetical protein
MPLAEAAVLYEALELEARHRQVRRRIGRWGGGFVAVVFAGGLLVAALGSMVGLLGGGDTNPASGADCLAASTEVVLATKVDGSGFEEQCFEVPGRTDFRIRFANTLPGSHSIAIFREKPVCEVAEASGGVSSFSCEPAAIFLGDPVEGIGTVVYRIHGLEPGTYYFHSSNPGSYQVLTGQLVVR